MLNDDELDVILANKPLYDARHFHWYWCSELHNWPGYEVWDVMVANGAREVSWQLGCYLPFPTEAAAMDALRAAVAAYKRQRDAAASNTKGESC